MLVITGATGQLGRLVIASLLKKIPATEIIAAVRTIEKAADIAAMGVQVRHADYSQPETWDTALKGADRVLLISSSELGQRVQHHRTVIDAAQRAGITLLAYTSVLHADTSLLGLAAEHRETESLLKASGIPFVLLRNGWYTENYTASVPSALAYGAVYGCAGDGLISSAARADYAEAAAIAITADHQEGLVYELAGDSAYSLTGFAAEVSQQAGRTIGYVNLPEIEYKNLLLKAGLPEAIAGLLADSDTAASKNALFDDSRQLSRLIGRPTTPLATVIAAAVKAI